MTLFAKIIAKEIPARIAYEDDRALAFHDIAPQAPVHVLVVPKKPLVNVAGASAEDEALLGHLLLVARKLAIDLGIAETGYRLVINNGEAAGQTVFHLHVHLLGGRVLGWPPG